MTAFPTVYTTSSKDYSVVPDDGSELLRAASGKLRAQRLYEETRYNITFRLVQLTPANTLAIDAFYESYKFEPITWTDPFTAEVYDVIMTRPPRTVLVEMPWASVQVELEGTRQ